MTTSAPLVLAVDDVAANLRLLHAVLEPQGYRVVTAGSGNEALAEAEKGVDIVLLDVHLPDISGFEVCERLRANPATSNLPVVMITATAAQQRLQGIEAGADDFLPKPFEQAELLARVRSLVRIKRFQDELAHERAVLAERVDAQIAEIEQLTQLRRFLPEHLIEAIAQDSSLLEPHRREIAVLFADLRGFTAFSGMAEPEEVLDVLQGWHALIGEEVRTSGATVGHFAGDGVMLFWNDPLPCADASGSAVRVALRLVAGVELLNESWRRLGYTVGVGVGVASGYATIGMMGFEGRYDYSAVGPVVNLAARLSDEARGGRSVIVNQRAHGVLDSRLRCVEIEGGLVLPGFPGSVASWHVLGLDSASSSACAP